MLTVNLSDLLALIQMRRSRPVCLSGLIFSVCKSFMTKGQYSYMYMLVHTSHATDLLLTPKENCMLLADAMMRAHLLVIYSGVDAQEIESNHENKYCSSKR